ncbi:myb-like protein V [Capsicum annuum]|uniref:myb-like protein V n=1 Tax=Capsicum annuum TaxID=4072 RepID=UPI001FB0E755|nr:myb-like protein V [Capsicum annuum]
MAINTHSGKRLRGLSMGKFVVDEVIFDEPEESNPVESEKINSSANDSKKENEKEEEMVYFKIAPKRKSPTEPKKVAKEDLRRKLIDEESECEDEEPFLKKQKKQSQKKTPLIEVEDTNHTELTITFEQEGSEKSDFEKHESEHTDSDEGDQEEFEESDSEGTTSGSPSTKQQNNEDFPPQRTLIKCKNSEVRNNARWRIPRAKEIYITGYKKLIEGMRRGQSKKKR